MLICPTATILKTKDRAKQNVHTKNPAGTKVMFSKTRCRTQLTGAPSLTKAQTRMVLSVKSNRATQAPPCQIAPLPLVGRRANRSDSDTGLFVNCQGN